MFPIASGQTRSPRAGVDLANIRPSTRDIILPHLKKLRAPPCVRSQIYDTFLPSYILRDVIPRASDECTGGDEIRVFAPELGLEFLQPLQCVCPFNGVSVMACIWSLNTVSRPVWRDFIDDEMHVSEISSSLVVRTYFRTPSQTKGVRTRLIDETIVRAHSMCSLVDDISSQYLGDNMISEDGIRSYRRRANRSGASCSSSKVY